MKENGLNELLAAGTTEIIMQALKNVPQDVGGVTRTPFQETLNDTLLAEFTDTQSIGAFISYQF